MNYVAFKKQALNPEKPATMPSEWPWGNVVILESHQTPPDQSGEWTIMPETEFKAYKEIYRGLYNAHMVAIETSKIPQQQVKEIVKFAINFGQNLIIEFASENILMGITQVGKTKEVADYLANIMRYAQSGSLYEIMNEVDYLISNTVPSSLSPFVTEARLLSFKQKVQDYLT